MTQLHEMKTNRKKHNVNTLIFRFKNVLKEIVILSSYLLISIINVRDLILKQGTIGHNWDWSIPPTSSGLTIMYKSFSYIWNPNYLGVGGTAINLLPIFLGLFGFFGFNGEFISKALLVGTISLSGYSMYHFVRLTINGEKTLDKTNINYASFVAGYIYASSPFLYNDLIGGALTQYVTYAIAPILLILYERALKSPNLTRIFLASLALSILSISWQSLFIYSAIIMAFTIFNSIIYKSITGLLTLLKVIFFWIPLNLYWLASQIYSNSVLLERIIGYYNPTGTILNLKVHTPTLLQSFFGTGYWYSFFEKSIPEYFMPIWLLASVIYLIFIYSQLLVTRSKPMIFWTIVFVLTVTIASGTNSPLKDFNIWLLTNPNNIITLLFSGDPQRLVSPIPLAISVMFGISCAHLLSTLRINKDITTPFIFVILIISASIWNISFINGNLGGYVDNFKPSWYEEAMNIIGEGKIDGERVLYLPMSMSPAYLDTNYQKGNFQGGDPLVIYSELPTLATDIANDPRTLEFEYALVMMIYGNYYQSVRNDKHTLVPSKDYLSKLLSFTNIKYIINRQDVVPNFGPFSPNGPNIIGLSYIKWNNSRVYQILSQQNGLHVVKDWGVATLWINNEYESTLIYPASNVIVYNDSYNSSQIMLLNSLTQIIMSENFKIGKTAFIIPNQVDKTTLSLISRNFDNKSVIDIKIINPTHIRVFINASDPFVLVFQEAYSNRWKAFYEEPNLCEVLFNNGIEQHFVVNGFANGWIMDKKGIYVVNLYYAPQYMVYVGTIISVITVTFGFILLSWSRIRKRSAIKDYKDGG